MNNKVKNIEDLLFELYYSTNEPTAYSSCERLYKYIKNNTKFRVKKDFIKNWLNTQRTYSLHKNRVLRFNRAAYNITNIDDLWEIDLIDVQQISRQNRGFKYILAVIDCFSKFAWCIPIKRKTPKEVINAFNEIFTSTIRRPITIQSDKGKEFDNSQFRSFLTELNISYRTTRDPVTKAAICERFIRTIKSLMYKYFTFLKSNKYVEVLNSLLYVYNNRKHSSIGMAPNDVDEKNILTVWNNLQKRKKSNVKKIKYRIGDTVRISNQKSIFDKGYKPKWSEEIFTVHKCILKSPPVYRLRDSTGALINGNFYEAEIQKFNSA